MSTVIWLGIIANIFLTSFIIALVKGLVDNSRKLLMISAILFIGTGIFGSIAIYMAMNKSFNFLQNVLEPRNEDEIYTATFGNSTTNCSKIINSKDHIGPTVNCCLWLQFQTCPAELERLIFQHDYSLTRVDKRGVELEAPQRPERPGWWSPRILGDSILVFKYSYPGSSREQMIFSSMDSTMVFFCDASY